MLEGETAATAVTNNNTGNGNGGDALHELSSFLDVSVEKLQTIDEVVVRLLVKKIQDFNEFQSQNLRLNVTIDEIKSLSTKRSDSLKGEIENLIKENDAIRQGRISLEQEVSKLSNEKNSASIQIENLKAELANSSAQRDAIKSNKQDVVKLLDEKVSELEASKSESERFLIGNKQLRNQILELETEVQNLKSLDLNSKSELQTTKQQLVLLRKNNEWLEQELTSKSEQFIQFRLKSDNEMQNNLNELATIKNEFNLEKSTKEVLLDKNEELSKTLQEKLLQIKDLSDTLSIDKQEFSREMALKQRLIDLLESQVNSLQAELRSALDKSISNAADSGEEGLGPERETLIDDLVHHKQKLEESEHERIRLEAIIEQIMPEGNGSIRYGDNERSTSLSASNGEANVSKVYGDISVLKKQLIKERHQKESLQRQVESFIVELEYKIPVINSFKQRTSMLEKELNDVALLLEHTSNEKEKKDREFQALSGKINQYESNIHSLVKQRSDLAHQVQFLLLHVSIQNDSRGPLTTEEVSFVKKIINNECPSGDSDSQRVISERLVEFKNIITLQEKNTELLKTVRNLADKLEAEEREVNSNIHAIEGETINEAKEAIVTLQSYNSSLESKIEAIEKERDAYKTLSSRTGHVEPHSSAITDGRQSMKDETIKNLESRLTGVITESSKNIQMLNDEIQQLYKSKSHILISLEKEHSSRSLAEERLKVLQNTMSLAKKENSELLKRSQQLQDILTRQEARTGETLNEYIACKSRLATLESKISNLEAERSLLRSSEHSSKEEIKKLSEERNTLKIVVTQLQTLQSERELLLQDTQKSYKEKLDTLEQVNDDLRAELDKKLEDIKALDDTKNTQIKWYQDKVDILREESKGINQELVEKTVLVGKLESEIRHLGKQLGDKEARIISYKVLNNTENGETMENALQNDLEKTKISLKEAYSQVEQYKALSSINEESLNDLTEKFKNIEEQLDAKIKKFSTEKSELERNISILKQQKEDLNNEAVIQKKTLEEEKNELAKKLSSLEGSERTVEQLKEEYESKMSQLQNDVEEQAAYANKAQMNYEEELQKHAHVSKTISNLREQAQLHRVEMENLKASEQQAKIILEQSEKSWLDQKTEYETQMDTEKRRIEDLADQNKLLYDQIELFSKSSEPQEGGISSEVRELLANLRRERDILATKLTVSQREENLLRQRQAAIENDLIVTRTELAKLKENSFNRSEVAEQHQKVLEQLDQLNLLRESNITLRNAAQDANKRNSELQNELATLQDKLLPLQSEVDNLRNSMQQKDQEISLYKAEADRWKERSQDILRRHESIDPEEYKNLEKEVSSLKKQLEDRIKENSELNDRFSRLKKQAHEKLNASKVAQASMGTDLSELSDAKANLEENLKEEEQKVRILEAKLAENGNGSATIFKLQNDLNNALTKSDEIEQKLEKTVKSSTNIITQLNAEIETLKEELKTLKEMDTTHSGNEDITKVVESMKRTFEEEKINFIREKVEEFNRNLEEQNAKISNEAKNLEQSIDVENLKKKWEEEYEASTLKRIEEAEENLKKRIRMPTEERINKVLEKKKTELEHEYQKKLKENSLVASEGDVREELKKQLEKELQVKYEDDLKSTKKKAFEEGKQQAAMKTTLLERKISKLESQIQDAGDSKAISLPQTSQDKMPSKIDERSITPDTKSANPLASGEKVLKLDAKPAFSFQPLTKSNPFTSPLQGGPFSNTSTFGMKPTFKLSSGSLQQATNESSPFGTLSAGFNVKPQNFAFSLEQKPGNDIKRDADDSNHSEAISGDNDKETTSDGGVKTPLKRSAESEESDGSSDSKRLKENDE